MIGIVAPSSVVPKVELRLGAELLEREGFRVKIHPDSFKSYRFFAGTDEQRAEAFFEFARDPECEILWCARGGYGAARILAHLERLSASHGDPRPGKLLIGYSDSTALFEFVRREWGWSALHAPMPGLRSFLQLREDERGALLSWARRQVPERPWNRAKLKHVGGAKSDTQIEAEMIGGNLTVWTSLAGTPYFPAAMGKILFFEDISEFPYRIDRSVTQLDLAGGFDGVLAIVLGDFLDCADQVSHGLIARPKRGLDDASLRKPPKRTQPIRKKLDEKKLIPQIFGEIGEKRGFPVFAGLPVGHGPGHFSLPIGARYRLSSSGELSLGSWDWLRS